VIQQGFDITGITTPFYIIKDGRLLLHKRGTNCKSGVGQYDPGCGKLEFGLDIEDNIYKEISEEYGIDKDKLEHLEQLPYHMVVGDHGRWLVAAAFLKLKDEVRMKPEPNKVLNPSFYELSKLEHLNLTPWFKESFTNYKRFFKHYLK